MARIALFSVGDRPVLAEHAAPGAGRRARRPPTRFARAADAAAAHDIDPPGDIHASSRYRRHLAAVLTRRVLERAFHAAARQGDRMKIYDLSQPLNEQVSLLAVLPAVRGEVHQAQGRARRQRAVHHDVEPHGDAPRRAAPLRHRRDDDRRDSRRVAVRPRRDRQPVGRDGRARRSTRRR